MAYAKNKTVKVKEVSAIKKARKTELSEEEETHEEMEEGKKDEEVYTKCGREELEENDEIKTWEEGFMEGAHMGGEGAKCRNCGRVLGLEMVEREFHDEIERFCSEKCAEKYEEKHCEEEEE